MTAESGSQTAALAHATRQRWLGVLARAERGELAHHIEALQLPPFVWVRGPEIGMVMLRARAGGTGQAFNLGEATVTRCTLRAGLHVGTGYVLGRDVQRAEHVARLDAALQDAARQADLLRDVIEPLARAQVLRRDAASRAAASTKVEFFTLVRE